MEYVEGSRTLEDAIKQGDKSPFYRDPVVSLRHFEQLANGLAACHAKGIAHRDLSPRNVLIKPNTHDAIIIDFGICKTGQFGSVTSIDEGFGTRCYAAPECDPGNPCAAGPTADLYSAGKILWSVVTGRWAFDRETPAFDNMSLEKLCPDHPSTWHLQHVFKKTIRAAPGDRWDSAETAEKEARRIRGIVEEKRLYVSQISTTCSLCGWDSLENHLPPPNHMLGNPPDSRYRWMQCKHCGNCFVLNFEKWQSRINHLEGLT